MGLKWFRAHLSLKKLKKEASKVPGMIGLYRKTSHIESNEVSAKNEISSSPIISDSIVIVNNEETQRDRSKADLASQLSSSSSVIDSQEYDNHENVNTEPSTSKDSDLKESLSQDEELNKLNKERSDNLDIKSQSDNELIDSNLKKQSLPQDKELNKKNNEQSDSSDIKSRSNNESVDSNLKEQSLSHDEESNNKEQSDNSNTKNRSENEWLVI